MGSNKTKQPQTIKLGALRASPMIKRGQDDEGRWYWRVRAEGRTLRGVRATEAEAADLVAEMHRDPTSWQRVRASPRGARVGDVLLAWVTHQRHRHEAHRIKESTLKRYQQRIGVWRGSDIAGALASRLRRQDIQHVMLEWEAHDHMARTSVRVLCQVFVSAWRWGIREGMAPPLDLTRLSPPRKPGEYVYRSYTPTRDEVASVLRHIPAESHRSAVHLMALTGARIGEALAATVGDYDGVVLKLKGKTGPREFPVTGELRKLLERLSDGRQPDERLCRMRDGRRVNHALIRACEAAEIEEFTPHALRRRVVMDLLKITDPATVGKLTGHSPQILLRDYVRPSADDLRNVVARAPLSIEDRGKVVQLLAQSTGTLSGDDDE